MSQLRTSSERKLSLSATRQPFTVEIALLFVFSLSNSLFFVSFLRLSDLSHTQEQAGSMPWIQAVATSRATTETAVRRCERSTKEPIATNPSISKDSRASCGYDTLNCAILSKYELLRASARRQVASARRQIGTGLFFSFKPLSISLQVCLGTSFEFVFALDHEFFLRNDEYGQEVKIISKCPTSAIASPHVKYVKGC